MSTYSSSNGSDIPKAAIGVKNIEACQSPKNVGRFLWLANSWKQAGEKAKSETQPVPAMNCPTSITVKQYHFSDETFVTTFGSCSRIHRWLNCGWLIQIGTKKGWDRWIWWMIFSNNKVRECEYDESYSLEYHLKL